MGGFAGQKVEVKGRFGVLSQLPWLQMLVVSLI